MTEAELDRLEQDTRTWPDRDVARIVGKLIGEVRRLQAVLEGLLDGLDANDDPERAGLSQQQWNRRIAAAHAALAPDETAEE